MTFWEIVWVIGNYCLTLHTERRDVMACEKAGVSKTLSKHGLSVVSNFATLNPSTAVMHEKRVL